MKMPDNKVSEAQKLYVNEIRSVQETAVKWKAFLDFSAQLKISDNQSQYIQLRNCNKRF